MWLYLYPAGAERTIPVSDVMNLSAHGCGGNTVAVDFLSAAGMKTRPKARAPLLGLALMPRASCAMAQRAPAPPPSSVWPFGAEELVERPEDALAVGDPQAAKARVIDLGERAAQTRRPPVRTHLDVRAQPDHRQHAWTRSRARRLSASPQLSPSSWSRTTSGPPHADTSRNPLKHRQPGAASAP